MFPLIKNSRTAVILLHEIYGINRHITEIGHGLSHQGYDVYCPDLLKKDHPYEYTQQEEAYLEFNKNIGFQKATKEVEILIKELRPKYEKVILIGYSIGATIAWLCAGQGLADGMIGYYGSRIRDYIDCRPKCRTLLIFSLQENFDVENLADRLEHYNNVKIKMLKGRHGFCDPYADSFNPWAAQQAKLAVDEFLKNQGNHTKDKYGR